MTSGILTGGELARTWLQPVDHPHRIELKNVRTISDLEMGEFQIPDELLLEAVALGVSDCQVNMINQFQQPKEEKP